MINNELPEYWSWLVYWIYWRCLLRGETKGPDQFVEITNVQLFLSSSYLVTWELDFVALFYSTWLLESPVFTLALYSFWNGIITTLAGARAVKTNTEIRFAAVLINCCNCVMEYLLFLNWPLARLFVLRKAVVSPKFLLRNVQFICLYSENSSCRESFSRE